MSDNEENCDYTLNQILHAALLSRGYTVREEEGKSIVDVMREVYLP